MFCFYEVVARTSGQQYNEYVRKNILDPLEMSNSSYVDYHALHGAATGNMVRFGISAPYDEKQIPVLLGASNLSASAEEMTHYLIPYFNRGRYHDREVLVAEGEGWYDDS
jgi:CubicO group peptidase (beta-lactamase class C family)